LNVQRPSRLSLASAAAAALLLLGCEDAQQAGAPLASGAALDAVVLEPERTPLERQLDGTIEAVNQGTVAAQTAGRVAAILYDVNDFVPADAVIVRLRATEQRAGLLQAEAALREAAARETEAQTRYQRIADMYERKVVARAMLDEATATRDAAVARLNAARAALESAREGVSYTEIRAPYAGIVTRRHVEIGETVGPGTPIMSGISLQFLRVVVDVPQSIVEQVRQIRKAAVYVGGRRIEATKLTVFPEASSPSNTFRARLDLPENATDLYPGMFVKVGFVTGEAERLLVPARALVERGEVTAVYVVDASGRTSLRQVRPGHRFDDRVEILAGLGAGERVALDPVAAMRRLEPSTTAAGNGS
jgi:RND family efflux transporter MFP subunit